MIRLSKYHNPNYVAKVVSLQGIRSHCNADRLQCASVDFQNIIVGIDAKPGDRYVYFPVESSLSKRFLSGTNSFSKPELNKDSKIKGYFSSSGRVKAIKLRGERSQGYAVPISDIENFFGIDMSSVKDNTEFDVINDETVVQKYVVKNLSKNSSKGAKSYSSGPLGCSALHLRTFSGVT